jgi:hypothetical protein
LPAHTQSSSQGISDNGVFVGLSTRPIHSKICIPHQFNLYRSYVL